MLRTDSRPARTLVIVPVLVGVLVGLLVASLVGLAAGSAPAAEEADAPEPVFALVTDVLLLPVTAAPLPAFAEGEPGAYSTDDREGDPALPLAGLWPHEGDEVRLAGSGPLAWRDVRDGGGTFALAAPGEGPAEAYLAFFVQADRWQEATLAVAAAHPVVAYLNGEKVALKEAKQDAEAGEEDEDAGGNEEAATDGPAEQHAELELTIGKHLVVLRLLFDPEVEETWDARLRLGRDGALPASALTAGVDPSRHADIHDILDAPRITSAALAPDGALAAVALATYPPRGGGRETWLEVRRVPGGEPVSTWRGLGSISRVQWAPHASRLLSYVTDHEGKSTLWLADLEKGTTRAVFREMEDLGSYRWAPDGSFVVFDITVEPEKDERGIKRVRAPADRQPWWRNLRHLMQASVPDGALRRLTAGPVKPSGWRIAPDGARLLFFASDQDLATRPYFTSEMWEMDLRTLETKQLLNDRWISGAEYAPDGRRLLLRGSPSAFDGLGLNLPEGVQPNDYGGQLYFFDPASGEAEALTLDLDPDVSWFRWSRADGRIYALCTDRQERNLYAMDPGGDRSWRKVATGHEYTDLVELADDARLALARGTSATTPNRLFTLDLRRDRASLLLDPGAEWYRDITFGEVEDWTCRLPDGEVLDGRVYYPPGFDPDESYPLIVYYYGGTSPVTRDYGGRYPKNVWAGQGYLVYVPEPSGATGYGQEFAARHVNDWGKRTAWEVIEGTRAFLAAHPYADGERVGCIGASYGGFLTQFIVTQTDIYAGAVSHAGISSISSYWGEGFWGYAYGARALADAFPWQDRELYVMQSPLFHADKITTPLLLLHGDSDTNVPVGESDQLFTALKLLGREVEYVQITGQNHHILDHEQRAVWNDVILAFFARTLKDRRAWWDEMFPEEGADE